MRKHFLPTYPSGAAIRDLEQPGYYQNFSTLRQRNRWDETTQRLITKRVEATPAIRFFTTSETEIMESIIERLLPQDDRANGHTIPILPVIDERLFKNELNGYRYEDMPPDQEAYQLGIRAIDEMAQEKFNLPFIAATVTQQELLLESVHNGTPDPKHPVWNQMSVTRFWTLLLGDCVAAYYSHPWAWDEIGFGGPAYPRGYMRLEHGQPEPWEEQEQRYEWYAPSDSISDLKTQPSGKVTR